MLQKFKISSYAIIFFLFLIPFSFVTMGSAAQGDWEKVVRSYCPEMLENMGRDTLYTWQVKECLDSLEEQMGPRAEDPNYSGPQTESWTVVRLELQRQLAEATATIASLQEAATAAATLSTPACACADGNGLGDGALPQDLGATANDDMLRKQCQDDHAACMRKIKRGSNRVKAKKRNACNHARMGPSGIQGTCG